MSDCACKIREVFECPVCGRQTAVLETETHRVPERRLGARSGRPPERRHQMKTLRLIVELPKVILHLGIALWNYSRGRGFTDEP